MKAISHVSLGTNDFPAARRFYDGVLATLGLRMVMGWDEGAGYGRDEPEFWIQLPHDGAAANPGNGTHVCFSAESEEQVKAFHRKALELGAEDEGKPGVRMVAGMLIFEHVFFQQPVGNHRHQGLRGNKRKDHGEANR